MLNKIQWLDELGRATRSKKNEKLENFLTDLQRLTIVHETDHGGSYYRFASGSATPAANDTPKENDKAKDKDKKPTSKDPKEAKKASFDDNKGKKAEGEEKIGQDEKHEAHGALEGDKTMDAHHGVKGEGEVHRERTRGDANAGAGAGASAADKRDDNGSSGSGNGHTTDDERSSDTQVEK